MKYSLFFLNNVYRISEFKICVRKNFVELKTIFDELKEKAADKKKTDKDNEDDSEESGDDEEEDEKDEDKVNLKAPKGLPNRNKSKADKGKKQKNDDKKKLKFTS